MSTGQDEVAPRSGGGARMIIGGLAMHSMRRVTGAPRDAVRAAGGMDIRPGRRPPQTGIRFSIFPTQKTGDPGVAGVTEQRLGFRSTQAEPSQHRAVPLSVGRSARAVRDYSSPRRGMGCDRRQHARTNAGAGAKRRARGDGGIVPGIAFAKWSSRRADCDRLKLPRPELAGSASKSRLRPTAMMVRATPAHLAKPRCGIATPIWRGTAELVRSRAEG